MTHQINGEDKAPYVSQSHDGTLDRGGIKTNGDGNIDQSHHRAGENDQLVSGIAAEGVEDAGLGVTVSRVDILAEKRKDGPVSTEEVSERSINVTWTGEMKS